jgi:O-antigen/teichoic acid export membrane protein
LWRLTALESHFGQRKRGTRLRTAALVAYRAASDIVGKAAIFVVTVVAARRLSPEGFGIFAIGTTVGWVAVVASDFGLQMHLARSVARAPDTAGFELRRWLRLRLAFAIAALLVVAASLAALGARRAAPAILLFAIGYLAAGVVEFVHHFYRGLSRTDLESTLTLWLRVGTLAAACLALWLRPEPAALAAAMLVPPLATAVITLRMAAALAPDPVVPIAAPQSPAAEFIRDVAPIGAGVLLSALYFRLDVFLLEMWQGTETVGLYNAVFRLIDALRLFPAALLAVLLPTLVRAATIRPLAQAAAALTGFGLAAAVVLWASAGWLVPMLYGPAFAAAVPTFRVLAAAFPLMALNYALTQQLVAWNGHRAFAWLCLAALIFNVGLNARFIPVLSLEGAAWATLATEALLTAGCAALLARATVRRRPAAAAAIAAI